MFTLFSRRRKANRARRAAVSFAAVSSMDSSPMPDRVKEHVFALDARWCDELEEVLFSDPVPNLYSIEHYLACPLPVRSPRIPLHYYQGFVGCERDGQLCCVLLLGSNVVPVRLCGAAVEHDVAERVETSDATTLDATALAHRDALAQLLLQVGSRLDSMFGESVFVMPLWTRMQELCEQTRGAKSPLLQMLQPSLGDGCDHRARVLSERPNQPLLYLPPEKDLARFYEAELPELPAHLPAPLKPVPIKPEPLKSGESPAGAVQLSGEAAGYARLATSADLGELLPAAAAMFTEEVGFDPIARYGDGYAARLRTLIAGQRSAIVADVNGRVIFKADAGIVNLDAAQVQGVWLHPDYRGYGLAKPFFAAAAQILQRRYPHLSLYVNDYNARALAMYRGTGWEQIGQFSTIIFER
ncbi:MAG: GNAT family N-acetyltransferase [Corynebacterium propinquum]|uniref:GNAT family N-acetyltransferase n=1 Tax=Rothia mucilaginosa TaxID=43675 RepID=UPI000DB73789|nr:GNAT family N-acetyltransferase [Rothia mucilaginosa]PZQ21388.1 MAG: GNAT family N-acetyltransferase [Corynebacterium propinquum]